MLPRCSIAANRLTIIFAPCHPLSTVTQRDRHDHCLQELRREADGQRHGEQQRFERVAVQ